MDTARLIRTWLLVLLTVISVTLTAAARAKKDVVILKNGDRITCQIKSLARGMLTVGTDSMGTVEIKWPDVDRITSSFLFSVEDTQGQIYVGSLEAASDVRRLNVAGSQGAVSNLDHLSIVRLHELEDVRWRRLSGSVDLGMSFTKASERKQFDFSGDIMYRTERYSGQLTYSSTIGTSEGETDADRQLVTVAGSRQMSRKWLAYSRASFEHNLELELDRRVSILGGPGYRIFQSNRALITAIGAGAFTRESYYTEGSSKNAEGFFAIDAQFFKIYSPKVDIVSQFAYLPNFSTIGRRRIDFNTKVQFEIFRDFFATVTFYDSYDSNPPSETAVGNDYGFTTGITWSVRR